MNAEQATKLVWLQILLHSGSLRIRTSEEVARQQFEGFRGLWEHERKQGMEYVTLTTTHSDGGEAVVCFRTADVVAVAMDREQ
jgi:hypothetical protein